MDASSSVFGTVLLFRYPLVLRGGFIEGHTLCLEFGFNLTAHVSVHLLHSEMLGWSYVDEGPEALDGGKDFSSTL